MLTNSGSNQNGVDRVSLSIISCGACAPHPIVVLPVEIPSSFYAFVVSRVEQRIQSVRNVQYTTNSDRIVKTERRPKEGPWTCQILFKQEAVWGTWASARRVEDDIRGVDSGVGDHIMAAVCRSF